MDLTLGNDIDIRNWICILVATWGDGTPLGPSSFKEQDVVKLCFRLGQEHPKVFSSFHTLKWSWHSSTLLIWWLWYIKSWQARYAGASPLCSISYPWRVGEWGSTLPRGPAINLMPEHICRVGSGYPASPQCAQPRGRAVRRPGIHAIGRTYQGCPEPQQWSITGSARGSPNWNVQEGGASLLLGSPRGNPDAPGGGSEPIIGDGEVDPRRERG